MRLRLRSWTLAFGRNRDLGIPNHSCTAAPSAMRFTRVKAMTAPTRFELLLALDHSRAEPWGSRHGQAFAAFALQHPVRHAASLDVAWELLYRVYCGPEGNDAFGRHAPRAPCQALRRSTWALGGLASGRTMSCLGLPMRLR